MGFQKYINHQFVYEYDFADSGGAVGNINMSLVGQNGLASGMVITDWRAYVETALSSQTTEVQKITFSAVPTTGSFRFDFGSGSASMNYDNDAAGFQVLLRLIDELATCTVTGNFTDGFYITMTGTTGDQALGTIGANSLGVTVTVSEYVKGAGTGTATVTLGNSADRDGYAVNIKSLATTGAPIVRGNVAGALVWDDTNDNPLHYKIPSSAAAAPSITIGSHDLLSGKLTMVFTAYQP
jgi:hypothetical protein